MTVGEYIRAARTAAGLRQSDLARLTGVSLVTIGDIERGRVPSPRLCTIELIADALEMSIDELVGHKVQKRERYMG